MEVETDDEKLQIVQERDSLKEMVSSLRLVVIKLLNEKALHDVSLKEFNGEETLYKSLQSPAGYHTTDKLTGLNNITLTFDLSNLIHEINDHSLLHSSNQSRFELDKCLEQVKEDATGLLALSNSENGNFSELIRRVEKEKYDLEKKVESIEKTQIEIREEIGITRDKLAQWERNLEVRYLKYQTFF